MLFTGEDKPLLVGWNTLLVLNLSLHIIDHVRGLDLQGDRLDKFSTDADVDEGLTWLVEPKRTKVVERFTHTLYHKAKRNDLRSSTIYTFSHFAFGYSNSTLVFADIQGKIFFPVWIPDSKFRDVY